MTAVRYGGSVRSSGCVHVFNCMYTAVQLYEQYSCKDIYMVYVYCTIGTVRSVRYRTKVRIQLSTQ